MDHVFTAWTDSFHREVFFAETASSDAVTGWQGSFLTSSPVIGGSGLDSQAGKAVVAYSTDVRAPPRPDLTHDRPRRRPRTAGPPDRSG